MRTRRTAFAAVALSSVLGSAGRAAAAAPMPRPAPAVTTPGDHPFSNPIGAEPQAFGEGDELQPPVLKGLDVHEHLGAQVPLDLSFTDSNGRPFSLRQGLHPGRPVILSLVYFDCPMLCSLVLDRMVSGLTKLSGWKVGKDYDLLTVSFNPDDSKERAAEKRRGFLQALGSSDLSNDWPFLTGDAASIKTLADTVGFDYRFDPQTKTFAHNAVIFVLTPDGKIARYIYGVTFEPLQLRLALTEAGQGKSGSSIDRFLYSCYHYDPASRKYGTFIFGFLKVGGTLVLLLLAGLLGLLFWRERHPHPSSRPSAAPLS